MGRTLEQAEEIIASEGAASWVGLTDVERLGCDVAAHHEWLMTAPESEIRSWAQSVAGDEPEAPRAIIEEHNPGKYGWAYHMQAGDTFDADKYTEAFGVRFSDADVARINDAARTRAITVTHEED